jgi:hypothetical protein
MIQAIPHSAAESLEAAFHPSLKIPAVALCNEAWVRIHGATMARTKILYTAERCASSHLEKELTTVPPFRFWQPFTRSRLRINPVQRSRKRNRLPHVIQPADPRHRALNPHAEARMRHAAVAPQIQVPLKRLARQFMFINPLA